MKLRQRIWEILEIAKPDDLATKLFNGLILALIFCNVIAVILETVKSIQEHYEQAFYWFEVFSITVFSIEYIARVWSCVARKEYSNPIIGRLRFMSRPMSIIDLLVLLPFYLEFVSADLRFIWALRLFRLFLVAKLGRYSSSFRLFARVLSDNKEELIVTMMLMLLLAVFASSFMYYAENEAQPDKFPNIPATMWWAVETLTTVGYGDIYPITPLGKLLAMIIAILGIGMFALPTGILGASFVEEIQRQKLKKGTCPHCGKEIE